ncbi:trihelix transcription factor ASR3-like isoform X1 [Nicotiana tomentosiformis]|uniref:Trihelix transcription factor ASR3-like n=1 Tax=Nicotiana tabacum TaxID=4097 RepID=A0A1S4CKL3_TOBAC|nr:PREDICTED: trihelix transcription factor ASR3-like [Nicotiana tabacum]XP_033514773.1 trihelix transcription factor ASR3-like isoform X1 [Nicotiana tomentosiformis]
MERVVANQSGGSNMLRDYRKGNWTVEETMVLIEAKKMDDERRMKRQGDGTSTEIRGNKPGELRWKWVEDYCWKMGCLRSQNQCNDKWDNLMRDFKKVREYERRVAEKGDDGNNNQEIIIKSYWKIERSERKEKNLPTNMLPEIYEALVQVVDRKCTQKLLVGGGGTSAAAAAVSLNPSTSLTNSSSPTLQQQSFQAQIAALPLPPPPPTLSPPAVVAQQSAQPPSLPYTQPLPAMCDSSDPDRSEHSDSPAKRRRKGEGEGTSSGNNNINNLQEVGSAIFKSAAIIAETIQASEEREERRHRELLCLHERRLQIEESKAEINRQGINGLVDSINKLANSILSLAGNKNQAAPPK